MACRGLILPMRYITLLLACLTSGPHDGAGEETKGRVFPALVSPLVPSNEVFQEGMSELTMRVDFEGGDLTRAGDGIVSDGPLAKDAFLISERNARSGRFCLRTKVAHSDDYISYGKHRAETTTLKLKSTHYNEGDVFRYRFSFCLDESWDFDNRDSADIIWQFKRFDGGPDMFIAVKGKEVVLRHGRDGQELLFQSCKPGEWVDMCLIIRWSAGSRGLVEAFSKRAEEVQYQKVASVQGPNTRDDRWDSTYLTWGIYKPDMQASTAAKAHLIYHDDIRVEKQVSAASGKQLPAPME